MLSLPQSAQHIRFHSLFTSTFLLFFLSLSALPAFAQITMPGWTKPADKQERPRPSLKERARQGHAPRLHNHAELRAQTAPELRLAAPDARQLKKDAATSEKEKRFRTGIIRELPQRVHREESFGFTRVADGRVGLLRIQSEGALGIRAHFRNFDLPEKATVFVYSPNNPEEYFGPFTGKGAESQGEFWSLPVSGDTLIVEYFAPSATGRTETLPFEIDAVSHTWRRMGATGTEETTEQSQDCVTPVPAQWQEAAKSVGLIEIINSKGEFACTGVLLNTATRNSNPQILSAAHCFEGNSNFYSVRWLNYLGPLTQGSPFSSGSGAERGEASDYALLAVSDVPAGVRFSGWTSTVPAANSSVSTIHHANAEAQQYALGMLIEIVCPENTVGEFCNYYHKVRWSQGVTAPGSSGAPLFTGTSSDPLLIGMLTGGTSSCTNPQGIDLFGRFDLALRALQSSLTRQGCVYRLNEYDQIARAAGEGKTVELQLSQSFSGNEGCQWTVSTDTPWITINSATAGTGPAMLNYTVASNPGRDPRYGVIFIAGQQLIVTQTGRLVDETSCPPVSISTTTTTTRQLTRNNCRSILNLGAAAERLTFSAQTGQIIEVFVNSPDFDTVITLLAPDGSLLGVNDDSGGASNNSNATSSRLPLESFTGLTLSQTGTYTLEITSFEGNETGAYSVSFSKICRQNARQTTYFVPAEGGTVEVEINSPPDCDWQASLTSVPWMRITNGPGYTGPQKVRISIDPTDDYAYSVFQYSRGLYLNVNGQQVAAITQYLKCGRSYFWKNAIEHSAGPAGETGLPGSTGPQCDWTLSADVPWITFNGPTTGKGSFTSGYQISYNLGRESRTGRIFPGAGQDPYTITQKGIGTNCQMLAMNIGQTINTSLSADCQPAVSNYTGQAPVRYITFRGTAGQPIRLTLTTLNQAINSFPATLLITPSGRAAEGTSPEAYWQQSRTPAPGDTRQFPSSGFYVLPETGTYTVEVIGNPDRPDPNGAFSLTITESSSATCDLRLSSTRESKLSGSGTGRIDITGGNACAWRAESTAPWLTISSGSNGAGNGAVNYTLTANTTGAPRTGILVVAGQHVLVTQYDRLATTVSSANYATRIAPGALVSIFGEGLATRTEAASSLPLPLKLAGTSVFFRNVLGFEYEMELLFVSPNQINLRLPLETVSVQTETEGLFVIKNEQGQNTYSAWRQSGIAPALFTANASGQGVAAANIYHVKADGSQRVENTFSINTSGQIVPRPIAFGADGEESYLVLYGTGMSVQQFYGLRENLEATIGNEKCEVTYAGAQGSYTGLDQINIRLPRTLRGRGEVPVKIKAFGIEANTVTITFAP